MARCLVYEKWGHNGASPPCRNATGESGGKVIGRGQVCRSTLYVKVQGHNVPFSGESEHGKSNSFMAVENQTLSGNRK